MARLASVIEDRPLPPADDPGLVRGLPPSPDTAVLALDHDGHPVGAAWWHFRDCPLVVTPDGAQVPEMVLQLPVIRPDAPVPPPRIGTLLRGVAVLVALAS